MEAIVFVNMNEFNVERGPSKPGKYRPIDCDAPPIIIRRNTIFKHVQRFDEDEIKGRLDYSCAPSPEGGFLAF